MIYEITHPQNAAFLFADWNETLIWSCLQNVMGKIYADNMENPRSAMALIGDFCFLAGAPSKELVRYRPTDCTQNFIIMVPQNSSWELLILKEYGKKAKKIIRYATQKEPCSNFDRTTLHRYTELLPYGYSLEQIDRKQYEKCISDSWSRDLVALYGGYDSYEKLGLGVVAVKENGEIVSGASAYSRYLNGIEIEIDTKESYRRQGFACACGARLILECLNRNLYPSWDAHNKTSLHLALKLGYHFSHEYPAYEIYDYSITDFD